MDIVEFLDNKPIYYDEIDYDVIKKSWIILKDHVNLPYIIHIIGTNGKGSTGRFLASFLNQLNKDVVHYSSPHINKFNERIWLNGEDIDDKLLDEAHYSLQKILPKEYIDRLTYFEYTTLAALLISSNRDYIVLEAGLGGEFDATNVVKNDLTLLTTIGLDHQDFLGDTVEKITVTKVRSCDRTIIVGSQKSEEVINIIKETLFNKKIIPFESYNINIELYIEKLPSYLLNNLKLALSALKYLNLDFIQFQLPKLFGRFQNIKENIIIDVGHNPLAANVILEQLQKNNMKVNLIYNSYKDKDYNEVLTILKPVVNELEIIECADKRMAKKEELYKIANTLAIKCKDFDIINLEENNNYLVFGSFIVVENFLKVFNIER